MKHETYGTDVCVLLKKGQKRKEDSYSSDIIFFSCILKVKRIVTRKN